MNSAVYQVYQHHRFQSLTHAVSLPADVMLEVGAEAGTHCGEAEAAHGHDGAHRPLREGRQRHPLLPLDAAVLLVAGEGAADGGRSEGQRRPKGRAEGALCRVAGIV